MESTIYRRGDEPLRREPYEVGHLVYAPGSKPFFFEITLDPGALNEVGILARILSAFSEKKAPVLHLKVSIPHPRAPIRVLLAADMKEKEERIEELIDDLKKTKLVRNVAYAPPLFNGLALDLWSFPLTFQGNRVVMMPHFLLEDVLKSGWSEMGAAFAALMYRIFFHAGKSVYEGLVSQLAPSVEDRIRFAGELFRMMGFGVAELVKLTRNEAVVRIHGSFECEVFKGAGEARSAIIRGLVAGFAAGYWGVDFENVLAQEPRCLAKGDPYCEFHVLRMD